MLGSCAQTGLVIPAWLPWSLSPLLQWAWPGSGCCSKIVEPHWRGSGWEAICLHEGPLCSLLSRVLECPEIPRFPASGLSVLPCPFKTSKKHSPKKKKKTALVSFHPLGAGGRGTWILPVRGLYLTPFARHWVLAGVDVVWMLSCSLF